MIIFFVLFFIFLFFVAGFSFIYSYKHLLNILLRLEIIVLVLFLFIYLYLLIFNFETYFCLYFLTFSVCEGVLGLSILVSIIRTHGNDYFINFSILQC
jgi:NADH-ubiquinone oxidoreductase chain 4L